MPRGFDLKVAPDAVRMRSTCVTLFASASRQRQEFSITLSRTPVYHNYSSLHFIFHYH